MRPLGIVLLLSLALYCCFLDTAQAEVRDANCPHAENKMNGVAMCTKDYNPVCGSDGKTYGNECMLCYAIRIKGVSIKVQKRGKC